MTFLAGMALFALFLDDTAQGIVLLVTILASIAFLFRKSAELSKRDALPWRLLALALSAWFLSAVLGAIDVSWSENSSPAPAVTEYFDFAAYLFAICAVIQFGRRRSDHADPTNWLDALTLTIAVGALYWVVVAVPNIDNDALFWTRKVINCAFGFLDLTLFMAVTRLAIGPGSRTKSYYLLFGFNLCVLVSDAMVSLKAADILLSSYGSMLTLVMTLGFVSCCLSALQKDSALLTTSSSAPIGRMTTSRVILTSVAILLPVTVLVLDHKAGKLVFGGLGLIAILVTCLVMARFAGLVSAREEQARVETILRDDLAREKIAIAAMVERKRIERDLHDGVQQRLLALAMRVGTASFHNKQEQIENLEWIREELVATVGEVRNLARGILPSDLKRSGLRAAIENIAKGLPLEITITGTSERLPEAVEVAAYFVACEALANAVKHAAAHSVVITLTKSESQLMVNVADDGKGGAEISAQGGLSGLADRVNAVSGTISVHSPVTKGTTLTAVIPI